MGLLQRIFAPSTVKATVPVEGEWRPGPYYLPLTGGWLSNSVGQIMNWWQCGYDPQRGGTTAMIEACVGAYAQTIAMCPGDHWLLNAKGGRDRVQTSALSRILRRPNGYQSISDLLLNITRSLYLDGNAYVLALRNNRFEIDELHLFNPRACAARVAVTGDIFYYLTGNDVIEQRLADLGAADALYAVPARDVLHIRLHTPQHPLRGETPLAAAAYDVAASGAISQQQIAFFLNQARPSYILGTDQVLTKEQVDALRARWDEHSQGLNQGRTPILTAGLKPLPLSVNANDAQLAEILKLTDQHIALVFRVPLQILGIGGVPLGSTEMLMQAWIASGLGFALNHIEEAIGRFFGLKGMPDEYLEFDTRALLRSAHKDRIEALARGVQGGIYAPNEARAEEGLPAAVDGDEPRVQQQVVPLSYGAQMQPPSPQAPATDAPKPPEDEKHATGVIRAADILAAADAYDRRAA